mmetsp:Transcript_370/g.441  ORF Transcript_370/g.441 Transcript_370/m.441 type:complete len:117 (-) Transcript_370:37-387(-)
MIFVILSRPSSVKEVCIQEERWRGEDFWCRPVWIISCRRRRRVGEEEGLSFGVDGFVVGCLDGGGDERLFVFLLLLLPFVIFVVLEGVAVVNDDALAAGDAIGSDVGSVVGRGAFT